MIVILTHILLIFFNIGIPLMREGRLSAQFWSIYTDCKTNFKDGVDWALEQIDITERMIQTYPEFVYVSKYMIVFFKLF